MHMRMKVNEIVYKLLKPCRYVPTANCNAEKANLMRMFSCLKTFIIYVPDN
jgi:hypothetical protein